MNKFLIALAALPFATPAFAQDTTAPSGFRAEARAGFDRAIVNVEVSDGTDTIRADEGRSGLGYGGEIGYDYASGNTMIGVYAGLSGATTKYCTEIYGDDEGCLKAGRNITVGLRGGFAAGTNSVVYIKGGYSNGGLKLTYEDPAAPEDNFDEGGSMDGWHLGAGFEANLSGRVYGKIEYTYTDYADYAEAAEGIGLRADIKRHQVFAGVGVRF